MRTTDINKSTGEIHQALLNLNTPSDSISDTLYKKRKFLVLNLKECTNLLECR